SARLIVGMTAVKLIAHPPHVSPCSTAHLGRAWQIDAQRTPGAALPHHRVSSGASAGPASGHGDPSSHGVRPPPLPPFLHRRQTGRTDESSPDKLLPSHGSAQPDHSWPERVPVPQANIPAADQPATA